jgi:hypothetical protein
MSQALLPVIRPDERQIIRAATLALRDIHDRGFVDYQFTRARDLEALADRLEVFLKTYDKAVEAPLHRLVEG